MAENLFLRIPPEKQTLLNTIVERLAAVPGVRAIVLGGSYARGAQRPDSDLDVGIYYAEAEPFRIEEIGRVAESISARESIQVTGFYGWGPWVNGGGWIHTAAGKVDFLYRNLDQVQRTITEAQQGITHHDFNQQPPYGFYSVIYLAETKICHPLYDPQGEIARLKAQVEVYPPLLKEKTVASTLWLAEFSLSHAESFARTGNVYTTTGALTRTASYLTQALFALNETYFIGDKTALQEIATFALAPEGYGEALSATLAHPGRTADELYQTVQALRGLWSQVVQLTSGAYKPAFQL